MIMIMRSMTIQLQVKLQLHNILLSFLLLPTISVAILTKQIQPGSTLYASNTTQTWSSPNNTFSLTFIPLNPPTSPPSYLASIVFSGGIPVWSAGTTPLDSNASFQFHPTGNLLLLNGTGHTIWDSATANLGISSASLDDYGNLVLANGTLPVWSSFNHPTNTLLPSQNFTTQQVLRNGLYSFSLHSYGNITLKWNNDSIVYWNQGLNKNLTSPTLGLQSNGTLSVYDTTIVPRGVVMAYSNDHGEGSDILRFLRLDEDGNLRMYSSVRGSGNETVEWVAIEDQCRVFGYCGNMGICRYNGTNPICGCPSQNFELVDPKDSRKGCKRKMEIENCPLNVTMLDMEHTLLLTYPPQSIFAIDGSQIFFVGISACRLNCLVNPTCDASTTLSDGTGMCYYKTPEFITGYQSAALRSTSYVKVCPPVLPNPSPGLVSGKSGGWRMQSWVVAIVVIGIALGLIVLEGSLWWCCRSSPKFEGLNDLFEYASGAPIQFSFKELQRCTKGFKEKLGTGGFSAVYKGVLTNRTVVAVKQLEGIEQGEKQFRMEIGTISSTHHLNLVRLIGFCSEGRHRILVYEFMQNRSLDNLLFQTDDNKSGKLLNWECRFNIAIGAARGITYLHDECRVCIVHCDIKPENILLNENYTAKVSDFGLSKLNTSKENKYRTLTNIRGTRGYLAPEWLANLPITTESDVYSYGMVLLEIVSGRRNFEVSAETNWKMLSVWAYEEFEKGNVTAIVDRRLVKEEVDMEQVVRAIQVSFWCIQEQPLRRPGMVKVVQMLEGITKIDSPPSPKGRE